MNYKEQTACLGYIEIDIEEIGKQMIDQSEFSKIFVSDISCGEKIRAMNTRPLLKRNINADYDRSQVLDGVIEKDLFVITIAAIRAIQEYRYTGKFVIYYLQRILGWDMLLECAVFQKP